MNQHLHRALCWRNVSCNIPHTPNLNSLSFTLNTPSPTAQQPQDNSPILPKTIQANITSGLLHLFGLDIPLPIRGTGRFEVLYLDERLRVFRSGGALAVQVKEQYLQEQGVLGSEP